MKNQKVVGRKSTPILGLTYEDVVFHKPDFLFMY
jgi:hypothetical protein